MGKRNMKKRYVSNSSGGRVESDPMMESPNDVSPNQNQQNSIFSSVNLTYLTILFSCLTAIFFIITMALIGVKLSRDTKDGERERPHAVCVPCQKLVGNTLDANTLMNQLKKTKRDGVDMCCAQTSDGMSALLRLVFQLPDSIFRSSPVRANKRLLASQSKTSNTEGIPEAGSSFTFTNDTTATEYVRNVEIGEDFLLIPYTGLYYVYAIVHFKSSSAHPTHKLFGFIQRLSPSRPSHSGALIKVVCQDCIDDQETAFSGGAFELLEGDKIRIICSAGLNMSYSLESSYAGLVMLASG